MKNLKKLPVSKKKSSPLTGRMDALFDKLDKIALAPASIFKAEAQKERYESLVMFAFRKRQSALYHRKRIDEIAAADHSRAAMTKRESEMDPALKGAEAKITVTQANNDYAHELAAFCAAVRSAMDFLAKVMGEHTKAVKINSIQQYVGWAEEGRRSPTVDVVAAHAKWLAHIRDYRDYLVHRLVLNTMSGYQHSYKDGKWTTTIHPISVPSDTPTHVPDTRKARAYDDPEHRFEYESSRGTYTDEKGNLTVFEDTLVVRPARGDMHIQDMMDRELKAFEAFFRAVIEVLIKLDFQPSTLPHPPRRTAPSAPQSPFRKVREPDRPARPPRLRVFRTRTRVAE